MKKKMVNYEIDSSNPPANDSSAESGVEGAPGQAGNKIDCSDIPPLQEDFWKKAVPNRFIGKRKPQQLCASIPTCCIGCALMAVRALRSAAASIADPLPR